MATNIQYITPECINEVMNAKVNVKDGVKIGMCATEFVGSDRYACVITEVLNEKKIRVAWMEDADYDSLNTEEKVQYLKATQMLKYVCPNSDGTAWEGIGKIYTLRKNGRWLPEGSGLWETGSICIGYADNYRDPSF